MSRKLLLTSGLSVLFFSLTITNSYSQTNTSISDASSTSATKSEAPSDAGAGTGAGPGAMLKRFDANHDGKLDDDEKKALHAYMEQRRKARSQGASGIQK